MFKPSLDYSYGVVAGLACFSPPEGAGQDDEIAHIPRSRSSRTLQALSFAPYDTKNLPWRSASPHGDVARQLGREGDDAPAVWELGTGGQLVHDLIAPASSSRLISLILAYESAYP